MTAQERTRAHRPHAAAQNRTKTHTEIAKPHKTAQKRMRPHKTAQKRMRPHKNACGRTKTHAAAQNACGRTKTHAAAQKLKKESSRTGSSRLERRRRQPLHEFASPALARCKLVQQHRRAAQELSERSLPVECNQQHRRRTMFCQA